MTHAKQGFSQKGLLCSMLRGGRWHSYKLFHTKEGGCSARYEMSIHVLDDGFSKKAVTAPVRGFYCGPEFHALRVGQFRGLAESLCSMSICPHLSLAPYRRWVCTPDSSCIHSNSSISFLAIGNADEPLTASATKSLSRWLNVTRPSWVRYSTTRDDPRRLWRPDVV